MAGYLSVKFSIITVCFNAARTIEDTLRSIASQTFPHIEHVVVDGASTDGTQEIIGRHRERIATFLSEPDGGLYQAMNKGLALTTGDYVGFLNADDVFADSGTVARLAAACTTASADACWGDLVYVKAEDLTSVVRYWRSSAFAPRALASGWHPPHPTLYVRRTILDALGGFDTQYRFHADFDLMARLFLTPALCTTYLPEVLVRMRVGGHTNRSLGNIVRGNLESLAVVRKHGIASGPGFLARKLVSRIPQFFSRPQD